MLRGARRLALPAVSASREMAKLALLPPRFLPSAQRADALDLLLSAPIVVKTPRGEIRMLNHGRQLLASSHHSDQRAGFHHVAGCNAAGLGVLGYRRQRGFFNAARCGAWGP